MTTRGCNHSRLFAICRPSRGLLYSASASAVYRRRKLSGCPRPFRSKVWWGRFDPGEWDWGVAVILVLLSPKHLPQTHFSLETASALFFICFRRLRACFSFAPTPFFQCLRLWAGDDAKTKVWKKKHSFVHVVFRNHSPFLLSNALLHFLCWKSKEIALQWEKTERSEGQMEVSRSVCLANPREVKVWGAHSPQSCVKLIFSWCLIRVSLVHVFLPTAETTREAMYRLSWRFRETKGLHFQFEWPVGTKSTFRWNVPPDARVG